MDVFAFLTDFPLILTICDHFLAARPDCFMQYLRNWPTDFGFQWRIRTAWPIAFISGVGKKNRVISRGILFGCTNLSKK